MEPLVDGLELADTSVWARKGKPGFEWFSPALAEGKVAVCDMVVMELLWSTRDGDDFRATEEALLACPWYSIEPRDWEEARRVFRELAVAARHDLTLVHYDSDYDIIASVTGQPTRWAAPRGSP